MTFYEELVTKHGYIKGQVGVNSDGENVIVTIDEESASVITVQENGWLRQNIYYPDGTEEELYTK